MLNGSCCITYIIKYQEPVLKIGPEPPLVIDVKTKVERKALYAGKDYQENDKT